MQAFIMFGLILPIMLMRPAKKVAPVAAVASE
jgi:hypothetical protein